MESNREENVKKLSQFDRAFKPWKKWQSVKLSNICPCDTCDVEKEYMARRYEFMMSEGADGELAKNVGVVLMLQTGRENV